MFKRSLPLALAAGLAACELDPKSDTSGDVDADVPQMHQEAQEGSEVPVVDKPESNGVERLADQPVVRARRVLKSTYANCLGSDHGGPKPHNALQNQVVTAYQECNPLPPDDFEACILDPEQFGGAKNSSALAEFWGSKYPDQEVSMTHYGARYGSWHEADIQEYPGGYLAALVVNKGENLDSETVTFAINGVPIHTGNLGWIGLVDKEPGRAFFRETGGADSMFGSTNVFVVDFTGIPSLCE
jgi:hypothetical protein